MSFGSDLKQLRQSKNIGVNELALHSGVSASQISRFENGKKSNPKSSTLQKLAKGLGVPEAELFKMAGINLDEAVGNNTPQEIDLGEQIEDKNKILKYQGRPIPEEDLNLILRLLKSGKDDDAE
ncbi:helix-turn-helix domain-containing protein [Lactiplantibacillus plantarum]|uniref:helix-turn-helix domain-containing protein n=1 Tax=Lactiplantibacillus plantarum TaxID=1590 RepID=UPI000935114D|nr:helix-turn-helix transcriptional regulator [Lactiplantibacillus plantarum]MCC6117107.1 helix-turn-helix domain-containing protein [Lactiplantibacillus plantarum]MCW6114655.1 helix-turn-helix domain-containing protein [Lactiplantibacillus plantarum]